MMPDALSLDSGHRAVRYGGNNGETMKTSNNQFLAVFARFKTRLSILSTLLMVLGLLPQLTTRVQAAAGEDSEDKPRNVVPVFRLDGPLAEQPQDDAFSMFSLPGVSLRDLVAYLTKAADDSAVKAIVILPDSAELGQAQIEELRAALA